MYSSYNGHIISDAVIKPMNTIRHIGAKLSWESFVGILVYCGFESWNRLPMMTTNISGKTFKILTACTVRGSICVFVPNFVPTRQSVAEIQPFFEFSRWPPSAILNLQKLEILTAVRFGGLMCVIVPNFVPIEQSVAEIWPFFLFF